MSTLRNLSPETVSFIYENYGSLTVSEIAEKLGISSHTVRIRIKRGRMKGLLPKASPEKIKNLIRKGTQIRERKLLLEGKRKPLPTKEVLEELYIKQGLSQRQIAEKLGFCQQETGELLKKCGIPARPKFNLLQPNLKPSPALAYILGVLKGDGNIYGDRQLGHYRITLEVTDPNFANSFYKALTEIGLHPFFRKRRKLTNRSRKLLVGVVAMSRVFYDWYENLPFSELEKIAEQFPLDFIRGFYESEGTFSEGIDKRWLRKRGWLIKTLHLTIANTNKRLLELCQRLLKKYGIASNIYLCRESEWSKKPCYALYINRKAHIRKFLELIKPVIKGGKQM